MKNWARIQSISLNRDAGGAAERGRATIWLAKPSRQDLSTKNTASRKSTFRLAVQQSAINQQR